MIEALWPGGLFVLVGAVVVIVGIAAYRRRSFNEFHHDLMIGNEDTGVLFVEQRDDYEPPPEPLPPPMSDETVAITPPVEEQAMTKWLADVERIPSPEHLHLHLRDEDELVADVGVRLQVQLATMRERLRESGERDIERMRWAFEDMLIKFENDMGWHRLLEYADKMDAERMAKVLDK